MTRLIGLKKELNNVNDMAMLGKVFHVVFNTNTKEFFSIQMIDGIVLGKRDVDLGWVDITELCVWYGRKVNYANCRFYALKVLENDPMVMYNLNAFNDSYQDDRICVKTDEELKEIEMKANETCCINNLYGELIEKCESSNYAYFAVRQEDYLYDPGDWAFNSSTLLQDPEYDDNGELIYPLCAEGPYKGFYVGPMLPGTCGFMFYDYETFKTAITELNYSGDKITIIAGDTFEYGDDINEVIIHNARVIAQYQKEECLCIE